MVESSTEVSKMIKFEEETEGDHLGTTDYFFHKIGDSVPLAPHDFKYDLQTLPSRPLAVSEHFQLIFVAHSSGFWMVKTKDVMKSAKEIKAKMHVSSIQELSVVDVPIGKVDILALSADSSTLAASVGGYIHFFSVNSLLSKEQKPSSSCSLNESTSIKDIQWIKKIENSYIVLSSQGKLYHGALGGPLKDVMDNVDAVEWSVNGSLIVVARNHILSILSSKFRERLSMSLLFKSWVDDSDVNCIVKVDSIRWVRPDCIIIGCLQVSDGIEGDYMVQVITTNGGKFTDDSSSPVVLSFCDLYPGLIDDIVPFGSGPHLFLSYLEQYELAITANRKNTDQHIVLFGWSKGDEKNKAAVIDINRETWLPRIELQENDDDNLVLGISVDKVCPCENIKVQLGVEEEKELSPYCVLFCLTLEGKLTMFHVASDTETVVNPSIDSIFPDEEEDVTPSIAPLEHDLSKFSSVLGEKKSEQEVMGFQLHKMTKNDLDMNGGDRISHKSELKPFELNISSASMETITGKQEVKPVVNFRKLEAVGQQKPPLLGQCQDTIDQKLRVSGQRGTESGQLSLKTSQLEVASYLARDLSKAAQGIAGVGCSSNFVLGKSRSDISSLLNENSQKGIEVRTELQGKIGLIGLPSVSPLVSSNEKNIFLKENDASYPFSPSSSIEGHKSMNDGPSVGVVNTPGGSAGSPLFSEYTATQSALLNGSPGPTQKEGKRASTWVGNIEPLPSVRNSQLKLQDEKLPNYKLLPTIEKYRSPSSSGKLYTEPKLSKQFGNIKDMAKELDALLECIEETGGFKDACTVNQKSSIVALEQGLGTLSEKCRLCKSIVDERLEDIQQLLDKTVQVLARKIHIQGVIKQATDSQYWDLWDRQKLSSELELKQQHILKVNQDVTSQLIELERHFNKLELNKFGENGGVQLGRRTQTRFAPSRHIQSLRSLHNTMTLQLAAAEQLSYSLSKQMAVLSIESPEKQQNVKKELFETIGIPYDSASFSSPDAIKTTDALSVKKLLLSSNCAGNKDHSRRKQSRVMKNYEQESARRRRDSLDTSWASFEPPKTTVKRITFPENQKVKANKSLLSMDKLQFNPHMLEELVVPYQKDQPTPSTFLCQSGNKGFQDVSTKQASGSSLTSVFKWANDHSGPPQSVVSKSPTLQINNFSALSSLSPPQLLPNLGQSSPRDTGDLNAEGRCDISSIEKSESVAVNEAKSNLQSETRLHQAPSILTRLSSQTQLVPNKSNEISNLNRKETAKSFSLESGKSHNSPSSRLFNSQSAPKLPESVFQFENATIKNKTDEKALPSTTSSALLLAPSISPFSSSPSAPPFSLPNLSATTPASSAEMSLGRSFMIAKTTVDSIQTDSSISSSLSISSPIPLSVSLQASEILAPSYIPSPPLTSALETRQEEVQHSMGKFNLKTDATAVPHAPSLQTQLSTGITYVSSAPVTEVSTELASGNQPSLSNTASPASNAVLNPQPEQPFSTPVLFPASLSTFASGTAGVVDSSNDAATQEDEMEEEAPETSHTADLSLGSLGGVELGSAPNSAAPKTNPFGGQFGNAVVNPASSSFTMTNPSGELFRPASLSFQSLQPSQPSQPTGLNAFSGGFGTGTTAQACPGSGFGLPAHIGPGQQALGSVLGGFGQSRQLGPGLPGTGLAPASGFGSGFGGTQPTGGFANAATKGGFAGVASTGGGFAALASGAGGFASMASAGGGFTGNTPAGGGFAAVASGGGFTGNTPAGGGFAAVASGGGFPTAGGGFGAFSNQQRNGGGFSAYGSTGNVNQPSQLFTQMRK